MAGSALSVSAAGLDFQNPIVLAAGTAGYGREVANVIDLDRVGGIVTKAVSAEPRRGNPPLRVTEFRGGMLNAVGLANPGLAEVRREHIPWLAAHHPGVRKLVNVVGNSVDDFARVVSGLEDELSNVEMQRAIDGYELNVSCPNVKAGGMEFGADPQALRLLVQGVRAATRRPLFVKLSPTLPDVAMTAAAAVAAGANAITLVNTMPGMVIDVARRRPRLSFGSGGVSGAALLPIGVLATARVRRALPEVPVMGVGGVSAAEDALQYLLAGATLVGVGTAAMRDPRAPERIVSGLAEWCGRERTRLAEVIGTMEWPA